MTSPQRGHAAASPALHQGVAVAIDASRAKQAASCVAQPGAGIASGASTMTSASPQARSISSRCRSEEHTSELQSLIRTSYAVFCLKKKHTKPHIYAHSNHKPTHAHIPHKHTTHQ